MIEGSRDREAVTALLAGLQLGMTHIDTAEMYGNGRAEEVVSKPSRRRRDEVFLVSKVLPSNASYEGTLRACERSLRRLRPITSTSTCSTGRAAIPSPRPCAPWRSWSPTGKTRFIGVSNFDLEELQQAERGAAPPAHGLQPGAVSPGRSRHRTQASCRTAPRAASPWWATARSATADSRRAAPEALGGGRPPNGANAAAGGTQLSLAPGRVPDPEIRQPGPRPRERGRRRMGPCFRRRSGHRCRFSRARPRCAAGNDLTRFTRSS